MICAFFESASDGDESNESFQVDTLPLERVRECLDEIETNADPRHYTTPVAMDDLDEVRAALGYETINLLGGSYGTRAVLVYMRRHPERVRTAVLDGLAPVSMRLPSNMSVDAHDAARPAVRRLRGGHRLPRSVPRPAADLRRRHRRPGGESARARCDASADRGSRSNRR